MKITFDKKDNLDELLAMPDGKIIVALEDDYFENKKLTKVYFSNGETMYWYSDFIYLVSALLLSRSDSEIIKKDLVEWLGKAAGFVETKKED